MSISEDRKHIIIQGVHFIHVLQAKIQKHLAFEAEVSAHANAIVVLDNTGTEMIDQDHFASDIIRVSTTPPFYNTTHYNGPENQRLWSAVAQQ